MPDAQGGRDAPGLIGSAWRYRWMTLIIVLVAGCVGYLSSGFIDRKPQASATLSLADPRGNAPLKISGGASGDMSRYTANRAQFAHSSRVLTEASRRLNGRYSADRLASVVTTAVDKNTDVIRATATASTSRDAAEIANAVVTAYQVVSAADTKVAAAAALRVINARAEQISKVLADQGTVASPASNAAAQTLSSLEVRANDISTYAAQFGSGVVNVNPARVAEVTTANGPSKRNIAIALLLGLLLALAIAWSRADRHQRIESPEDAGELLGAPLLGNIPDLRRGGTRQKLTDVNQMPAEPYQLAATGLRLGLPEGVLLVVSADRQEGRTTTAANLAAGAAREGMRVALVEGDTRQWGLSRLIGIHSGDLGLTDVIHGLTDLDSAIIPVRVGESTLLSVLPAGRAYEGVSSSFRSRRMANTMRDLRASHDLVIVDSPPLLQVSDAAALAVHADGVLAVVRFRASVSRLQALRQQLDLLPTRVLGYVVTRPRRSRDRALPSKALVHEVEPIASARLEA